MMSLKRFLLLVLLALQTSCAVIPASQRSNQADALAHKHGWQAIKLATDRFTLMAYAPKALSQSEILTIYIEGDGLAWLNRSQPSMDPTPIKPIGLELAMQQPNGAAVYLARPCQYVAGQDAKNCAATYWTDRRFSVEVIEASNQAIEQLKQRYHAKQVELVGYSGGGAIAALVAAQRHDIVRLITVAGNLDHARWTKLRLATPLKNSLNPADAWESLLNVRQLHLIGSKDRNVSREVAESYQARFPKGHQPELRVIEGFDHACCWVEQWPRLYP